MNTTICKKCGGQTSELLEDQINNFDNKPVILCVCGYESIPRFDTFNLNEATYLVMCGNEMVIGQIAIKYAQFLFERSEKLESDRNKFWSKDLQVDLHRWIATRQEIKNTVTGKMISLGLPKNGRIRVRREEATSLPDPNTPISHGFVPRPGQQYWFAWDTKVSCAINGHRNKKRNREHDNRIISGNCFRTRQEAEVLLARKLKNV